MNRGYVAVGGQVRNAQGRTVASYNHDAAGAEKAAAHAERLNTEVRVEKCTQGERCDGDRVFLPEMVNGGGLTLCQHHREWIISFGGKP